MINRLDIINYKNSNINEEKNKFINLKKPNSLKELICHTNTNKKERVMKWLENNNHNIKKNKQKSESYYEFAIQKDLINYKIIKILGKGNYSTVYLAKKNNILYSIKQIKLEKFENLDNKLKLIQNEIKILKNLNYKGCLKLSDYIETKSNIFIITNYFKGSTLFKYVLKNKLDNNKIFYIFKQIVNIIKYLHNKNIYHRDIKLENILINKNWNICLIDYGFSININQNKIIENRYCGTLNYMSPEKILLKDNQLDKDDLWSLGVILYIWKAKQFPFKGKNIEEIKYSILNHNINIIDKDKLLNNWINKMLNKNIYKRISLLEIKNHYWYKKNKKNNNLI